MSTEREQLTMLEIWGAYAEKTIIDGHLENGGHFGNQVDNGFFYFYIGKYRIYHQDH